MMGGIEMDIDCATASPGLYVAGEDAVESMVRIDWVETGLPIPRFMAGLPERKWPGPLQQERRTGIPITTSLNMGSTGRNTRLARPFQCPGRRRPVGFREKLWEDMWDHVGIVRNKEDMIVGKVKYGNPAWFDEIRNCLTKTGHLILPGMTG